jgi:nitroreductase
MNVLDVIRERRSIRRYKETPVPLELMKQLLEAGRWAPTGGNKQYWKFIAVTNPDLTKRVKRASPCLWGECPAAIIICFDMDRTAITKKVLEKARTVPGGISEYSGYPSQNIMLAASALGLGTCAIGGFNREAIIKILEIPDNLEPILLITVGYPNETPKPKPHQPLTEVAFLNSCNNPWREINE